MSIEIASGSMISFYFEHESENYKRSKLHGGCYNCKRTTRDQMKMSRAKECALILIWKDGGRVSSVKIIFATGLCSIRNHAHHHKNVSNFISSWMTIQNKCELIQLFY